MTKKIITIFGSAFCKLGDEDYTFAYELGKKLGQIGFTICNGGFAGTMEATHKGASEVGAETIGITVNIISRTANKYVKTEIKCETLFERINKLIDIADGYIVLRGGTGTLLELSVAWELVNKNLIKDKPIIAYESFWNPLIKFMDKQMIYENRRTGIVQLSDNIDEICNILKLKLLDKNES